MVMSAQSCGQMHSRALGGSPRDRQGWGIVAPQSALILLLLVAFGLAGVLPCIVHCERDHTKATAESAAAPIAWFLCDFPSSFGEASAQDAPHHHHVAPQLPFEPTLAFAGLVLASLLIAGRLLAELCRADFPVRLTPPTPPPRSAH